LNSKCTDLSKCNLVLTYIRFTGHHHIPFCVDPSILSHDDEIEIRCIKLDSKNEYENEFPPIFELKVNNAKWVKLEKMSPSDAKRRKDTSIMAKEDLKTGFTKHTIEFKAAPYAKLERPQVTYFIGVFVVRNLSSSLDFTSFKLNQCRDIAIAESMGLFKQRLNGEEVEINSEGF
jgi:hypothetical protein